MTRVCFRPLHVHVSARANHKTWVFYFSSDYHGLCNFTNSQRYKATTTICRYKGQNLVTTSIYRIDEPYRT